MVVQLCIWFHSVYTLVLNFRIQLHLYSDSERETVLTVFMKQCFCLEIPPFLHRWTQWYWLAFQCNLFLLSCFLLSGWHALWQQQALIFPVYVHCGLMVTVSTDLVPASAECWTAWPSCPEFLPDLLHRYSATHLLCGHWHLTHSWWVKCICELASCYWIWTHLSVSCNAVSLPVCWISNLAPELNSHSDLQKTGISVVTASEHIHNVQCLTSSLHGMYTYIKVCCQWVKKKNINYALLKGCTDFPKSRRDHKILITRRVMWSKFYSEDPLMLGVTIQNLVTTFW